MSIDVTEYLPPNTSASERSADDSEQAGPQGDDFLGDESKGDESQSDEPQKSEGAGQAEPKDPLARLLPEEKIGTWAREDTGSARTTFRLSPEAIQLFERLSGRTGLSQKDLLCHALRLCRSAWARGASDVREAAARYDSSEGKEKSMAIAPATRAGLNDLANRASLPRNHLVEVGIRLAERSFEEAARKKLGPHEEVLGDLEALYQEVEEVQMALSRARTQNGSKEAYEDPVLSALHEILWRVNQMGQATREAVESGEPIEESREFPRRRSLSGSA